MYLPYLTKGGKGKLQTFYLLDVLLMTKIKCWPVDKIYLEFSQSMSIDCEVEPNVYEIVLIYWYNYLWNQCLSPLCWEFESRPWRGVLDKLCDKVCQWLSTDRFFPPGTAVSSNDRTEILLKVALSTITLTLNLLDWYMLMCLLSIVFQIVIDVMSVLVGNSASHTVNLF